MRVRGVLPLSRTPPTFRSIAVRPGFLLPVILWTLVSLGIGILIQPKIDYDRLIRSSLEKRGQTLPEERVQQIVAQQKKIGEMAGRARLSAPERADLIDGLRASAAAGE